MTRQDRPGITDAFDVHGASANETVLLPAAAGTLAAVSDLIAQGKPG